MQWIREILRVGGGDGEKEEGTLGIEREYVETLDNGKGRRKKKLDICGNGNEEEEEEED